MWLIFFITLACFGGVSIAIVFHRDLSFGGMGRSRSPAAGSAVEAGYWVGLGMLLILGFALLSGRPAAQVRVAIPRTTLDAIELGLETGVIAPREASRINDWLNRSVRTTARSLEVMIVDHEHGMPQAALEKARDGQELSLEERSYLMAWLIDAEEAGTDEIIHVVLDVARGTKLTDVQKRSLAAWLLQGPSHRRQYSPRGWQDPYLWGAQGSPASGPPGPPVQAGPDMVPMPPAP